MGGYHDAIRDGQLGKPHRGRSARRAEKRIGGHVVDAFVYGTACRLSGPWMKPRSPLEPSCPILAATGTCSKRLGERAAWLPPQGMLTRAILRGQRCRIPRPACLPPD